MRRILYFAAWLVTVLTGLIIILFAPISQYCRPDPIVDAEFLPGEQVALHRGGAQTELWTVGNENPQIVKSERVYEEGYAAVYSPDGQRMLVSNGTGEAWLKPVNQDVVLHTFRFHVGNPVTMRAYAPDGKTILIGSRMDHMAELYDVQTGTLLQSFNNFPHILSSLAYSPDSKTVITSNTGHEVYLWDAQSGKRLQSLIATANPVMAVAMSKTLAFGGLNGGTALIWDIQSGKVLHTLHGHTGLEVTLSRFSHDGKTLLTASYYDHKVILWDTQKGKIIHRLCPRILGSHIQLMGFVVETVAVLVVIWQIRKLSRITPIQAKSIR